MKWYHGEKKFRVSREKLVYTSFSLGSLWFEPSLKFRFWALLLEEILHKGYMASTPNNPGLNPQWDQPFFFILTCAA